jgi:hypothetical protein
MLKTSHTILVVDETPSFPELLKVIGDFDYNITIEKANSPDNAIALLKNIPTPSLVWSNNKFKNSKMDGKSLLKYFSQKSPHSSRILCGSSLPKVEMDLMVKAGQIHSYYNNPVHVVNPISSAIKLGIEFHKMTLLGNFIDRLDTTSNSKLDKADANFLDLEKQIGWEFGETRDWIDNENQSLELQQLSRHTLSVLKKIPTKTLELAQCLSEIKETKANEKLIEVIKHIEHKLVSIDDFLIRSNNYLKSSNARIAKNNIQIENTNIKIKKLKDEFMGE